MDRSGKVSVDMRSPRGRADCTSAVAFRRPNVTLTAMEWILLIVGLAVGGGAGWAIGFLLADRRSRREASEHQIGLATAQQQAASLAEQLKRESDTAVALRTQLSAADKQ